MVTQLGGALAVVGLGVGLAHHAAVMRTGHWYPWMILACVAGVLLGGWVMARPEVVHLPPGGPRGWKLVLPTPGHALELKLLVIVGVVVSALMGGGYALVLRIPG